MSGDTVDRGKSGASRGDGVASPGGDSLEPTSGAQVRSFLCGYPGLSPCWTSEQDQWGPVLSHTAAGWPGFPGHIFNSGITRVPWATLSQLWWC